MSYDLHQQQVIPDNI